MEHDLQREPSLSSGEHPPSTSISDNARRERRGNLPKSMQMAIRAFQKTRSSSSNLSGTSGFVSTESSRDFPRLPGVRRAKLFWRKKRQKSVFSEEDQLRSISDCVKNMDNEGLKEMLTENRCQAYTKDGEGTPLLHLAVETRCLETVKLLISFGADIDARDAIGNQVMHVVAASGDLEVFSLLTSWHANVTASNQSNMQPIHVAAVKDNAQLLQKLLDYPAMNINACDDQGRTPIHYCCIHNSVHCLKVLLDCGAEMYCRDLFQSYPVHTAVEHASHDCLKLLFGAEKEARSASNSVSKETVVTPTKDGYAFSRIPSVEVTQLLDPNKSTDHPTGSPRCYPKEDLRLVRLVDSAGESALHVAVKSGDMASLQICLDNDGDILLKQKEGDNPLHYACYRGDISSINAMLEARPSDASSAIAERNSCGYSPLHLAVLYDNIELMEYLVQTGAPLEGVETTHGLTPLLLAVKKGSYAAFQRLIQLGASVEARDKLERNLFHLILLKSRSDSLLLFKIINDIPPEVINLLMHQKDSDGSNLLHYAAELNQRYIMEHLLRTKLSILERNSSGYTPMHIAVAKGYGVIVKLLLNSSEGIRALYYEDKDGLTPLHRSIFEGHVHIAELLLERGTVLRKCHLGNTPLHIAAKKGELKICKVLLNISPSLLDETNSYKQTALHLAANSDWHEVVRFLLAKGCSLSPDVDGLYFTTVALEKQNFNTLRVAVTHQRWPEIWSIQENTSQSILDGLIRELPSLFALAMDQSVTTFKDEDCGEFNVTYDFSVLQGGGLSNGNSSHDSLHRIKLIAELKRQDLLFHPLCKKFLQVKWKTCGRWVHLFRMTYFFLILLVATVFVINDNIIFDKIQNKTFVARESRVWNSNWQLIILHVVLILIGMLHITFLVIQLFKQKLHFFREWSNSIELLTLFWAVVLEIDIVLFRLVPHGKFTAAVLLYLTWFNFLLQLSRNSHIGIFIIMFTQVFSTVIKCFSVFLIVILAFGMIFHVLLRESNYSYKIGVMRTHLASNRTYMMTHDEFKDFLSVRRQFNYLGISLMKTVMMMFGEYDHSDVIIKPALLLGEQETAKTALIFTFYLVFLLCVPMVLMNLLIGLAVGDINEIRKSARQTLIVQQINWLSNLELRIPKRLMCRGMTKGVTEDQSHKQVTSKRIDASHPERSALHEFTSQVEARLAALENTIRHRSVHLEKIVELLSSGVVQEQVPTNNASVREMLSNSDLRASSSTTKGTSMQNGSRDSYLK